jgi:hypothetical protein
MTNEVDINLVLSAMRETIGMQAQEIAMLKAQLQTLQEKPSETNR